MLTYDLFVLLWRRHTYIFWHTTYLCCYIALWRRHTCILTYDLFVLLYCVVKETYLYILTYDLFVLLYCAVMVSYRYTDIRFICAVILRCEGDIPVFWHTIYLCCHISLWRRHTCILTCDLFVLLYCAVMVSYLYTDIRLTILLVDADDGDTKNGRFFFVDNDCATLKFWIIPINLLICTFKVI